MLSVIIPASNEAGYIGPCLEALLASRFAPGQETPVELIVVANACRDETVPVARSYAQAAAARGWRLVVLDLEEGGKTNAFNAGDAVATGPERAYIDADIVVGPDLLDQIHQRLQRPDPVYCTGRAVIPPASSWVSRMYARFWLRLPFVKTSAPGFGVFAVNAAGRARWGLFPKVMSDDMFVRLSFAPQERVCVPATYEWPVVEGFARLVRVRRRQDKGVRELAELYPDLMRNEDKAPTGLWSVLRLAAADPVGFGVYATVMAATRLRRADQEWIRGR